MSTKIASETTATTASLLDRNGIRGAGDTDGGYDAKLEGLRGNDRPLSPASPSGGWI